MSPDLALSPIAMSRMQFAANITFHILFPSITIALGWILLFFKTRFNQTQNRKWMDAYFFWTKIFALCFAIGIVSGVTMSFQFGTNWPGFMNTVGNIAGPLLGYEVLTAFFLEATFLGIMLFGFRRVSPFVHTLATFIVATGTTLSAFWILALDSWMQTPAGFEMVGGHAMATDWMQIIFNPSMPYRIVHMLLASGLTASFLVAGISSYRWLKGEQTPAVLAMIKTGIYLAALLIPLQAFMGDQHGLNTLRYQPQKVAAMEGLWKTEKEVPLVLFGMPNEKEKANDFAIEVPKLGSLILTHNPEGEVKGLEEFPQHPPVAPLFWSFRIMVGIGGLMMLVAWGGSFIVRKKQTVPAWLARTFIAMSFAGWIGTIAGWYVTEIGRQPWLVQGVLLTSDAVTKTPAPMIGVSLTIYLALYVFLLAAFMSTLFYMARKDIKPLSVPLPQADRRT
jgi:cytochrome d ubiquinol oxidase subunit I